MKYKIVVYDWNPNGTNDIYIEGSTADHDIRCMDGLNEALFGVNVSKLKPAMPNKNDLDQPGYYITLKQALKHIAASPVEDGSTTVNFLKKYFKSIK